MIDQPRDRYGRFAAYRAGLPVGMLDGAVRQDAKANVKPIVFSCGYHELKGMEAGIFRGRSSGTISGSATALIYSTNSFDLCGDAHAEVFEPCVIDVRSGYPTIDVHAPGTEIYVYEESPGELAWPTINLHGTDDVVIKQVVGDRGDPDGAYYETFEGEVNYMGPWD